MIEIRFELFPLGKFKEIDDIWGQLGYNFDGGYSSGMNMGGMVSYMQNLNFDQGALKQLIDIYDQEVRSFKLSEQK